MRKDRSLTQSDLIGLGIQLLPEYREIMKQSHPYELKGIFHSELLMLCSIITYLMPEQVIESGRARGQSTEIIGRWTESRQIKFHSIESNSMREDYDVALKRLEGIDVALHLGDAFEWMPKLIGSKTTICLIDGPKGANMWKLFKQVSKIPNVIGVAMHDAYWESTIRNNLEREYKGKYLISDDPEFVKEFKELDEECWRVHPFRPFESGSYINGVITNSMPCKSYAGTLAFVGA